MPSKYCCIFSVILVCIILLSGVAYGCGDYKECCKDCCCQPCFYECRKFKRLFPFGCYPITETTKKLNTHFGSACHEGDISRAQALWPQIVFEPQKKLLLAKGLEFSAQEGHIKMAKWLIDHGAKVNQTLPRYPGSRYPLFWAARNGDTNMVRFLIGQGAEVNVGCSTGTPLTRAVVNNHIQVVRILLRHGANPQKKDGWGKNAFDYAIEKRSPELFHILTYTDCCGCCCKDCCCQP